MCLIAIQQNHDFWCIVEHLQNLCNLQNTKLHLNCNQTHTLSSPKCTLLNHNQKTALLYSEIHDFATLGVWCFASCIDFVHILLYTKIHDFATLKAELSFGCDSVRYTSVKKVYAFDCNSDVVWCFASCADFEHFLLYTTIHDFATLEAELSFGCNPVRYTSVKNVYVFDCNSDVVWCFASCIDFVHILLYTKLHLNCNQTHTLSSPKCTLLNHNQKTALLPM